MSAKKPLLLERKQYKLLLEKIEGKHFLNFPNGRRSLSDYTIIHTKTDVEILCRDFIDIPLMEDIISFVRFKGFTKKLTFLIRYNSSELRMYILIFETV